MASSTLISNNKVGIMLAAAMVVVLVLGRAHVGAISEPPPAAAAATTSSSVTDDLHIEAQALMAFKEGISSDPFGRLASWQVRDNSSAASTGLLPCTGAWSGIVCDAQKRHVTGVNLASSNLSGSISPSLALLPALSDLNLSNNFLSGGLPSSLFLQYQISALQHLDLSDNSLSGSLPDSLGNLSALLTLDLSFNSFVGEIPPSLGQNCKGLERLYLIETGLTGSSIPAEIWQLPALIALEILGQSSGGAFLEADLPNKFASCPTLRVLALSNVNAPSSAFPSSLGDCQQLRVLFLNVIGLQGFIAPEIWQLPLLRTLVVEDAQVSNTIDSTETRPFKLHGSLPSSFGWCQSITELGIDGVNLTGEIPPSLGQCTGLQSLDLSHGSLQGAIPEALSNLSNLQTLFLESHLQLTGTIPKQLFQGASGLVEVRLGANFNLSGPIPRELGGLKQLQVLSLYSTALLGPVPEELCNCTELVWLDIGWPRSPSGGMGNLPNCVAKLAQLQTLAWQMNAMNGEVPMEVLKNLTQLQYLDMSYATNVVGRIPPELGNLSNLNHLGFRVNSLSGPIPLELSQLPYLQRLDLTDNLLTGSLSEQFVLGLANGSTVTQLFLGSNYLQGVIPSSMGELQTLQLLYLDHNQIGGTIPASLGNCTALQDLTLHNNRLEGVIPSALGRLTGLSENLLLSSNKFSGEIPIELGAFTHLKVLDLSNNRLVGPVPIESLENCSQLQTLRLYQNHLTGRIEQFDLTKLQNLKTFTVHENHFIGGLPSGLTASTNLELFDVQRNNLSGTLPFNDGATVTGLSNLRVLVMSQNELSGEIPGWVWKLPMLQVLDLSNNRFNGSMPATVTHLAYFKQDQSQSSNQTSTLYEEVPQIIKATFQVLTYVLNTRIFFDISMNHLQGQIAESFGELLGLTGLNLSHNSIQGQIPSSLGKLVHLDELDLSHNHLTGSIPAELGQVGGLSQVDLSYNRLQGPIPSANNFNTRFNYTSFEGNSGLCGAPLLVSCSHNSTGPATRDVDKSSHGWSFIAWVEGFASPWALLITYPIGLLGGLYFLHRFRCI